MLDKSIIDKLEQKIQLLENENTTNYTVINHLKDIYHCIIDTGYTTDNTYIDLAAYILYTGLVKD